MVAPAALTATAVRSSRSSLATEQGQTTAVGQLTLTALRDYGYPMEDLTAGQMGFVSKAAVEAAGGPDRYFKQ